MSTIAERQEKIRAEFAEFKDQDDKWKYLLRLARECQGMASNLKEEKFLVKGCASRMFLVPEYKEGLLHFHLDTEAGSDNPLISRGLGALALNVYNDQSPAEILKADPHFFQSIGLDIGLTPTRANGFASMVKQIYLYAQVFSKLAASL